MEVTLPSFSAPSTWYVHSSPRSSVLGSPSTSTSTARHSSTSGGHLTSSTPISQRISQVRTTCSPPVSLLRYSWTSATFTSSRTTSLLNCAPPAHILRGPHSLASSLSPLHTADRRPCHPLPRQ